MKRALIAASILLIAACSGPSRTDTAEGNAPSRSQNRSNAEHKPPENRPPEGVPEPVREPAKPAHVKRGKLEDPNEPETKRALEIIERVTGMKFKQPIPVYIYTPEDLEAEMKEWGDGYVPENVLGFYRPDSKTFY